MSKVNYEILNALNLASVNLGDAYLQEGFNPFEEDFSLEIPAVKEMLARQKEKENIAEPSFLECDKLEITKSFGNALKVSEKLLESLELGVTLDNENNIKTAKVFLKMRNELLRQAIRKLKNKNINALALYKEIIALNPELSELLQDSFNPNIAHETAIQAFNNFFQISMQLAPMEKTQTTFTQPKQKEKPIAKPSKVNSQEKE